MTHGVARPIRAAVVGFGVSGRVFHTPFLEADPAYSLDVIVTGDAERAAEAARRHPSASVVATVEEMLARAADLDLVVIGTPPATHAGIATADANTYEKFITATSTSFVDGGVSPMATGQAFQAAASQAFQTGLTPEMGAIGFRTICETYARYFAKGKFS